MILEADAVVEAESTSEAPVSARVLRSSGVCVVGMLENVQPRNLGDPAASLKGSLYRNRLQGRGDGQQEVGLLHSTEEVG
jgi:hypothetical protein